MNTFKLLLAAGCAVAIAAVVPALARSGSASPIKTVTVVMHDPGCHWFSAGGKFKTTLAVAGPVKLLNVDEKALKVAGTHGTKRVAVGGHLLLGHGTYRITMVGQAPDDNHLKLTVA